MCSLSVPATGIAQSMVKTGRPLPRAAFGQKDINYDQYRNLWHQKQTVAGYHTPIQLPWGGSHHRITCIHGLTTSNPWWGKEEVSWIHYRTPRPSQHCYSAPSANGITTWKWRIGRSRPEPTVLIVVSLGTGLKVISLLLTDRTWNTPLVATELFWLYYF